MMVIAINYVCVIDKHDIFFFFFNDTATTEIYTLSLHDALPIFSENLGVLLITHYQRLLNHITPDVVHVLAAGRIVTSGGDRKSTRLNSSHANISYAVFCLKKKKLPSSTISSQPTSISDPYIPLS